MRSCAGCDALAGANGAGEASSIGSSGAAAVFSSNQNTLPDPTVLSTPIAPPISSTRRLAMTRPMPVPSSAVLSCPRRLKGWKSSASFSGGNPAPVSLTLTRVRLSGLVLQSTTTAPPCRLYLIAFDSRLTRTCFSRVRSARTKEGVSNGGKVSAMARFSAIGSIMARHSDMTSASETGSSESDSFPDSIAARSRISLMSCSRYHPACRIWSMLAFWAGVGGGESESISWAKPRIALSGERSSWLMLERNSDLARLAFSATEVALMSSASTFLRSVRSRVSFAKPRRLPAWSRIAENTTLAQKVDLSFRTRQPSSSSRPFAATISRSWCGLPTATSSGR